jgi:hypothetical protein
MENTIQAALHRCQEMTNLVVYCPHLPQANKPRLSRLLERVGSIWSKAVIGATLATLVGLTLAGVPLMEPGGAVYRWVVVGLEGWLGARGAWGAFTGVRDGSDDCC